MRELAISARVQSREMNATNLPKGIHAAYHVVERVWSKENGEGEAWHLVYVNEFHTKKLDRLVGTQVRVIFRSQKFYTDEHAGGWPTAEMYHMWYCDVIDT